MRRHWRWLVPAGLCTLAGLVAVFWLAPRAFTLTRAAPYTPVLASVSPPIEGGEPPAGVSSSPQEALELAAQIDRLVEAELKRNSVQPAPLADDAEFLRRVSLDVIGRIPSVAEARAFLADPAADKRQRLVERLLESPGYVNHFANVWRAVLLPQATNKQIRWDVMDFETWLKSYVRDNVGYDQLAREIIDPKCFQAGLSPFGFYVANEYKPENLAGSAARLFLGTQIECAQCHDHPFAHWKRQEFWEFAAFFAGVEPLGPAGAAAAIRGQPDRHDLAIPGTERNVTAHFLDGKELAWQPGAPVRTQLANWVTSPDNALFTRAAANRFWAHFFGIGLVEPVDDLSEQNPPSHPQLLDELARGFAAHQFDSKYLIRAISNTRTYQRSSMPPNSSRKPEPRLFACMAVRGLSPEQLLDSLALATGLKGPAEDSSFLSTPRGEPLALLFSRPDKPAEFQATILQALALMNGSFVDEVSNLDVRRALAAAGARPGLAPAQRLEALFLATLGRKPSTEESQRLVSYVQSGGPGHSEESALGDVLWALLNSAEFMLNH